MYGKVNPSAKLPETFPVQLEDNPSYLYYQGEGDVTEYREGVFVGYRYYEKKKAKVLFPFGHGLSYTSFAYDNLKLDKEELTDAQELTVTVDITNTGSCAGKEVVQLYVAAPKDSRVIRPVKELRGFEKVELQPGETKTVTFSLDKRAFAYWNVQVHDWWVESGSYGICIAASSADVRLQKEVSVTGTQKLKKTYTLDSTMGDVMEDERAFAIVKELLHWGVPAPEEAGTGEPDEMGLAMMRYMPLRGAMSFGGTPKEKLVEVLNKLNE